jgi:hypothetical protein
LSIEGKYDYEVLLIISMMSQIVSYKNAILTAEIIKRCNKQELYCVNLVINFVNCLATNKRMRYKMQILGEEAVVVTRHSAFGPHVIGT